MGQAIYLDNHATTPTDPRVVEAMLPYFTEAFGNPSSQHWAGAPARQAVQQARRHIVTTGVHDRSDARNGAAATLCGRLHPLVHREGEVGGTLASAGGASE